MVQRHRAIKIVLGIVLPAPDHFDGLAHSLGNLRSLHDEIHLQTTTEATAQKGCFQRDVFRLDAQCSRHIAHSALLELGRANQQAFAVFVVSGEILRLQRGVRQQLRHVLGFHQLAFTLHDRRHIAFGRHDWNVLAGV